MSLSKSLKSLKKQRRDELAKLHYVYLHTKRDIRRQASPDRFLRKHLGASIGAAAVLGFLFAPRPSPKAKPEKPVKDTETVGGHFSQIFRNVLMQVERLIPMPKDHAPHQRPGMNPPLSQLANSKGIFRLLAPLLTVLLSKFDLTRLAADITKSMMGKGKSGSNGHKPQVSVADAGTVKPENFQDFE